ncbi:MAG: nitric oxide synthase oxygenase [Deltaproteobacteria bacterium]
MKHSVLATFSQCESKDFFLATGFYAVHQPSTLLPMSSCPFLALSERLRLTGRKKPIPLTHSAKAFFQLLQSEKEAPTIAASRIQQAQAQITKSGTYQLTLPELTYGCRLAWRNSVRCVGRFFWSKLDVLDQRHASTEEDIYNGCLQHLKHATHQGDIRSTVTVFHPADSKGRGPRIWNYQLSRYAGYRINKKQILGDPAEANFTDLCLHLGWTPPKKRTPFDLLPIVISLPEKKPRLFPPPKKVTQEVSIRHPDSPCLNSLRLRWVALPVVSNMRLEIGGISFPAAPFSGWYMETEIGTRNFADENRYNLLPDVARRLRLDTSRPSTLWKDRALVELNRAVLHSFQKAGVRIIDHHSASASHLRFEQDESKKGRSVRGLWEWLIPPLSGSTSPLWNRSYDPTEYSPNFLTQKSPF